MKRYKDNKRKEEDKKLRDGPLRKNEKLVTQTGPDFFKRYDIQTRERHSRAVVEDLNDQYFTELRQIKDGDIGRLSSQLYQNKRQAFQDARSRTVMKSGSATVTNSSTLRFSTVKKKVVVPSQAQLKGVHHQSNHSQSTHTGLLKISKLMTEMKDARHTTSGWGQFNFQKRDRYRSELGSKNNIPGPSTTSEASKANTDRSQEKIILKNLSFQKKPK